MNCTDPTKVTLYGEYFNRALEWWFGAGPYDNSRIVITHRVLHALVLRPQRRGFENTLRLYNLTGDPTESVNIADMHMDIVEDLRNRISVIEKQRPYQQPYWMHYDLEKDWPRTFVAGDCSINDRIGVGQCHFTHPWLPDDVDPWKDLANLTNSVTYADFKGKQVFGTLLAVGALLLVSLALCCYVRGRGRKRAGETRASKKHE